MAINAPDRGAGDGEQAEEQRLRRIDPREQNCEVLLRRVAPVDAPIESLVLDHVKENLMGPLGEEPKYGQERNRRRKDEGRKLTAYSHGLAGSLIAIAKEWVGIPNDVLAALKGARHKLGTLPIGLTAKNKNTLLKFNDKRLLGRLVNLPDKLWREISVKSKTSRREFIDLQSALAIDILLVAPVRMKNLAALKFDDHIQWPEGQGRPAVILFRPEETKNNVPLEFELPLVLSDRLHAYRNKIAPAVTSRRPDNLFLTWRGKPRTQAAIAVAIEKTVLKYAGVRLTPHQFRHLAAKLRLDESPGAYELVRELMGHKNMQTTTNFYAGIDTRRAGRANLELIAKIRSGEID